MDDREMQQRLPTEPWEVVGENYIADPTRVSQRTVGSISRIYLPVFLTTPSTAPAPS